MKTEKKRQKRTLYTNEQKKILENIFMSDQNPSIDLRTKLGRTLGRSPRSIQIWFQNRRSAEKKRRANPDHISNNYNNSCGKINFTNFQNVSPHRQTYKFVLFQNNPKKDRRNRRKTKKSTCNTTTTTTTTDNTTATATHKEMTWVNTIAPLNTFNNAISAATATTSNSLNYATECPTNRSMKVLTKQPRNQITQQQQQQQQQWSKMNSKTFDFQHLFPYQEDASKATVAGRNNSVVFKDYSKEVLINFSTLENPTATTTTTTTTVNNLCIKFCFDDIESIEMIHKDENLTYLKMNLVRPALMINANSVSVQNSQLILFILEFHYTQLNVLDDLAGQCKKLINITNNDKKTLIEYRTKNMNRTKCSDAIFDCSYIPLNFSRSTQNNNNNSCNGQQVKEEEQGEMLKMLLGDSYYPTTTVSQTTSKKKVPLRLSTDDKALATTFSLSPLISNDLKESFHKSSEVSPLNLLLDTDDTLLFQEDSTFFVEEDDSFEGETFEQYISGNKRERNFFEENDTNNSYDDNLFGEPYSKKMKFSNELEELFNVY